MRQLFKVFIPTSIVGLVLSETVLVFLCYLTGTWLVGRFVNPYLSMPVFLADEGGLAQIGIVVACLILGLYFQDLYSDIRVDSLRRLLQQTCLVIGSVLLVQAFFVYIRKPQLGLPRWAMIFGSSVALISIPTWRIFYTRVILKIIRSQRVLFLGVSPICQEIAAHFVARPEIGRDVIGYLDDEETRQLPGGKIVGQIRDLTAIATTLRPDVIVVGMTERRRELPMSEMLGLRFSGIRFEEAAATFESAFGRVSTRELRPSRLVYSSDLGPGRKSLFWHSFVSIVLATVLLILFAPLMFVLAMIVKATSHGPVFHRQVRVGLNGSTFTLFKFRTMKVNAEAESGPVWAKKDDPRITPPGKWMRRLRFDELPQLLNVLRNEMALVGPRPERPEFVKSLTEKIPYYASRHYVKPGITGWAQINYKY